MPETRVIAARTHGRFLVEWGPPERLLVGFHGYGENAEESLAQMMQIPGVAGQWTVVAVQALHRFYRGRGSGTIAASWMTSQDRDRAVADNKDYVRSIVAEFASPRALVFLGFSQGVAMAYRAASVHPNTTAIVALAGDFPPDLDGPMPPTLIGRGTRENWYTDEKLKKDLSILGSDTAVETCVFEGGHEWTGEFRAAAGRFLGRFA
jgi:predicted esterase